jgi:hypothetical protein
VEAQKLFVAIVIDFFIRFLKSEYFLSLLDYIHKWNFYLWETCFFKEFRSKDGIRRSKLWEQHIDGVTTLALGSRSKQGLAIKIRA